MINPCQQPYGTKKTTGEGTKQPIQPIEPIDPILTKPQTGPDKDIVTTSQAPEWVKPVAIVAGAVLLYNLFNQ